MNNDSNTADNIRRTNIGNDKFVRTFLGELQANFSAREEARCRKVAIFPPTPLALAYSTVPTLYFFRVASQSQLIGPDFFQCCQFPGRFFHGQRQNSGSVKIFRTNKL